MALKDIITEKYISFIAREVIEKFGGSYQTYETYGKMWRQQMQYDVNVEKFLILQTKLFLRLLKEQDQMNLNLMYKVCCNISEHLSEYLIKKSPDLTKDMVIDSVLKEIFLNSSLFISKFKKHYTKRPINMADTHYVEYNPGVIAIYNAIKFKQK